MTGTVDPRRPVYDIRDYGALGNGTFDDAAACQLAINAAGLAGGVVQIPDGAWTWRTVPKLPRGITGKLHIRGSAGAKVTLTTTGARFADFNKIADFDVFQNIEISDLLIDANNITTGGHNHVIIGTYVAGSDQRRLSFDHITVRRVKTINVYSGTDVSSNARYNIWLVSTLNSLTDTSSITNIVCEDLDLNGGVYGIGIYGYSTNPSVTGNNIFCDKILVQRCSHILPATPTVFQFSANFHFASIGYGGSLTIRDCYGKNSMDVGIEVDAMSNALIENCTMEDAFSYGFFHTNFNLPDDPAAQTVVFKDCVAKQNLITATASAGHGFGLSYNRATPLGTVRIVDCKYVRTSAWLANAQHAGIACFSVVPLKALYVERFRFSTDAINESASAAEAAINIQTAASTPVFLRDCNVYYGGAYTGAGLNLIGYQLASSMVFDVEGCTVEMAVTGFTTSGARGMDIGGVASSVMRGIVRQFKTLAMGDDGTPRAIIIRPTTSLTIPTTIRIEECDFSSLPHASTEIVTDSAALSQILYRANQWRNNEIRSATTLTVPSSPAVYQNLDGYDEIITVRGGTVSKAEHSFDGTTYVDLGSTNAAYRLSCGDYLRVTYSGLPVMQKIPIAG